MAQVLTEHGTTNTLYVFCTPTMSTSLCRLPENHKILYRPIKTIFSPVLEKQHLLPDTFNILSLVINIRTEFKRRKFLMRLYSVR